MSGLVEELQSEALDPSVPISTLLRKVKVAATKLRLDDTVEWVELELKGYTKTVPPYRMLRGRPIARNSWGWQVIGGDASLLEALSRRAIGQPVSALEEICRSGDDDLKVTYAPIAANRLKESMGVDDVMLQLTKADFIAVLDHVRNLVLDWALNLEKAGIHGDGLSFTSNEKKLADTAQMNIKIEGPNARLNLNSVDLSSNSHSSIG